MWSKITQIPISTIHMSVRILIDRQEQCLEQAISEMGCGSSTGSCRCEHKTMVIASDCSNSNCTMADTLRRFPFFVAP